MNIEILSEKFISKIFGIIKNNKISYKQEDLSKIIPDLDSARYFTFSYLERSINQSFKDWISHFLSIVLIMDVHIDDSEEIYDMCDVFA